MTTTTSTAELTQGLEEVSTALADLEFGSVEITVHQGRIVQIERREKLRLDAARQSSVRRC